MEGSSEFELDDDKDGLFLGDNVPLFMKLRESERNRRSKMKEASLKMPRPDIEKDLCNAEGFYGPGLLNPFSSSHDKDLNDDFLMKDFENLLKRKPQDVHKRAKLATDQNAPAIAHLNLSATKPFTALYDRFDDFEDGTYLIN